MIHLLASTENYNLVEGNNACLKGTVLTKY